MPARPQRQKCQARPGGSGFGVLGFHEFGGTGVQGWKGGRFILMQRAELVLR